MTAIETRAATANVLELEDVHVSFDGLAVLDGLNFSMAEGELRFLIGPNGAGKTTMLDVITGRTRPAGGMVRYNGKVDVTRRQEYELVRLGIGRKFQTPAVFRSLTLFENLEVAIAFKRPWPTFLCNLPESQRSRIDATLATVGLSHRADDLAGSLSHGELQWLEIGMLLVQGPKLLLLDEPVAGMTRPERDKTGALLRSIAGQHSILVVEHDMAFVREYASTVSVLHLGKILSEGPVQMVQNDPKVVEVYLGHRHERTR
ncbi:MAG: urea transport system ATP-binding protein [Chloroflexota bacterium]|jgi:urea transport system ATP-binding protein|nr:urea transport system ATP-binding protein [Chloroflexota bacterium]